jgi:hypothetical protein
MLKSSMLTTTVHGSWVGNWVLCIKDQEPTIRSYHAYQEQREYLHIKLLLSRPAHSYPNNKTTSLNELSIVAL